MAEAGGGGGTFAGSQRGRSEIACARAWSNATEAMRSAGATRVNAAQQAQLGHSQIGSWVRARWDKVRGEATAAWAALGMRTHSHPRRPGWACAWCDKCTDCQHRAPQAARRCACDESLTRPPLPSPPLPPGCAPTCFSALARAISTCVALMVTPVTLAPCTLARWQLVPPTPHPTSRMRGAAGSLALAHSVSICVTHGGRGGCRASPTVPAACARSLRQSLTSLTCASSLVSSPVSHRPWWMCWPHRLRARLRAHESGSPQRGTHRGPTHPTQCTLADSPHIVHAG
jgi:hypothetical protein